MAKYKVPAIKEDALAGPVSGEERYPSVSIPIKKEWAPKIKVGEEVTVTVTGTVRRVETVEPERNWRRNEFELELQGVEFDEDANEFSELADA